MSSIMQILRRIGGLKTPPTSGSAGQLALWKAGTAATDAASLYAHDGAQWVELLDTARNPRVIDANDAVAGLRITQRGAGEALRVEDEANPDASPFVVDTAGKVGIGVAAPGFSLDVFNATGAYINIGSDGGSGVLGNNSSNNASGPVYRGVKSRGTSLAPTAVSASDDIVVIDAYGHDGAKYMYAGMMRVAVDGPVTANSIPTRFEWHTMRSGTSGPVEGMRLDQTGCLYVGRKTKAQNTQGSFFSGDGQFEVCLAQTSVINRVNSDGVLMTFQRQGVGVGGVVVSPSTTTYTTSSDYRLKENVSVMTDASARVMSLKPCRFNFKAEPGKVVDGFIAHEVQGVVPEAVTGAKDAVDADGNPDYQGIDQSKLVPLLTAALQDALKRIAALEARP